MAMNACECVGMGYGLGYGRSASARVWARTTLSGIIVEPKYAYTYLYVLVISSSERIVQTHYRGECVYIWIYEYILGIISAIFLYLALCLSVEINEGGGLLLVRLNHCRH